MKKQRYLIVRRNSTTGSWRVEKYYEGPFGTSASMADGGEPYENRREA